MVVALVAVPAGHAYCCTGRPGRGSVPGKIHILKDGFIVPMATEFSHVQKRMEIALA